MCIRDREEREKELFPEYYEEQETKQDRIMVKLTFFILSVLVAVIWIGAVSYTHLIEIHSLSMLMVQHPLSQTL